MENDYLPQFIGFVTQDQPKELLNYFESQRPVFKKRADEFLSEEEAAIPKQLDALLEFASRAYRRPLQEKEKTDLLSLYKTIRAKGAAHKEAFRGVLARVLVSPAFLFRIENAPAGKQPGAVNDWELATRLGYFLWASAPDNELRKLAAAGQLREPKVLAAQVQRMLKDDRQRPVATPSSSGRSGFTSAASTNSRRRTRSCSRRSMRNFARRSTRNRSCSSRICSRVIAR